MPQKTQSIDHEYVQSIPQKRPAFANLDVYAGNGSSSPDVAFIWQVAPISSLHIPLVAVVGRLPVLEWDAFPQTNDVVLVAVIYGDTGVASLDVYAGNGSSLPDVAVIWQVAPISSLHIPPVVVVGRLPVVERYAFPRDNDNLTLHSVKLTAVYTSV